MDTSYPQVTVPRVATTYSGAQGLKKVWGRLWAQKKMNSGYLTKLCENSTTRKIQPTILTSRLFWRICLRMTHIPHICYAGIEISKESRTWSIVIMSISYRYSKLELAYMHIASIDGGQIMYEKYS